MGRVFRAVHGTTGVAVAVKVILGACDGATVDQFHREVQAQAGLAHPGVVYLFDYGTLDEGAHRDFDEEVSPGSPYVVMELADQGTLSEHIRLKSWQVVREILLQVLDALAYGHAREVIHRDLKPENLLVFGNNEGARRIKLADFGLAHAFEQGKVRSQEELTQVSGTPYYMTPEQFHGAWRSYGPWTDLYSLGCVAWHLVCGKPPYVGESFYSFALKHCADEIPALEPRMPLPDGVEEWIRTAMAVEPKDRFQRAADAAWALPQALEPARSADSGGGPTATETAGMTTLKWDEHTTHLKLESTEQELAKTVRDDLGGVVARQAAIGEAGKTSAAPMPMSWKTARTEQLPAPLLGTGLGLFGLREVPFVDRDGARDRLWRALCDVVENDTLRVVFVRGESGVGKSRLVRWMATRAHEVGAVKVLPALHTPGGRGPAEGFSGMIQRVFHAWKLSRADLYQDLLERLPPLDEKDSRREIDARALTQLVLPADEHTTEAQGPHYQFSSAKQRYSLLRRLISRFAKGRTPLLWIDDLQYSTQAMGFLDFLLRLPDDNRPGAAVFATLRTEVLADDPTLAQRVDTLVESPYCQQIELDPIEASDHRELIDLLLPLEPELADHLAERTEGNPLFSHQLLNHWIDEGSIELSEAGFGVPDGQSVVVPDDIHELWMNRLERALRLFPSRKRRTAEEVVELAAALGREVDQGEWRSVCAVAGRSVPDGLESALLDRGLAKHSENGWVFKHGLFVDSLERNATEAGRWKKHHRHCAEMLANCYPEQPKKTARRRVSHWINAGELERALAPLLQAAERDFELGDTTQWKRSLKLHRQLLDRLDVERCSPQRLENDLRTNKVLSFEGQTEQCVVGLEEVLRRCQKSNESILEIRARRELARCLLAMGDFERAQREIESALDLATEVDDDYWQGMVVYLQCYAWTEVGEIQKAVRCNQRAKEHFRKSGSTYDEAQCDVQCGWVQLGGGQYRQARATFRSALDVVTQRGFRNLESVTRNGLGDIARFLGEFEEARRHLEQAYQIQVEMGDADAEVAALLNLAQVELALHNLEGGRQWLKAAYARAGKTEGDRYRDLFHCVEIVVACGERKGSKARRILQRYVDGWPENRPVWNDHPWLLERAAQYAEDADDLKCARRLWELCAELWEKLGSEEAASQARKKLVSLDVDSRPDTEGP